MFKHLNVVLACCTLLLAACGAGDNLRNLKNGPTGSIARAHGLAAFDSIRSIDFTFTVERDATTTSRQWRWLPKKQEVVFFERGDSIVFKRMDTSTIQLKKLNAQFTNDEYWLLFPMHLQWDDGYTFTVKGQATAPISARNLHLYSVQYNKDGGFTPGDRYDIYTDEKDIIREWSFHKGGSDSPTLTTTWEGYKQWNGLIIATNHVRKDGKFRIYFTGIVITR